MSIYKGFARFRFYFEGRSHTLVCHRCILQIVAPSSGDGHRGCWSAIGVFAGNTAGAPSRSTAFLQSAFQTASRENFPLEGIFCLDTEAAIGTTLSGPVTVTHCLSVGTAEAEGLRLVLIGRETPRIHRETREEIRPSTIH